MSARFLSLLVVLGLVSVARAADWPQWRGQSRDAKVADFRAPAAWPKELTKKWSVTVGDGAATPALVGDRLYVFAREDQGEVAVDILPSQEVQRQLRADALALQLQLDAVEWVRPQQQLSRAVGDGHEHAVPAH